ncbi:MAG: hypothetical protein K1Y02_00065 [Candidatus Hydrogenedentes bacterium]|nr:hypothetical protein [Candidatus Hydrogenedentota bacterium]
MRYRNRTAWEFTRFRGVEVVLVAILLAALAGSCQKEKSNAQQLEERLAAIRAVGEPVTMDELRATLQKVTDADNAAPILQQAFTKFDAGPNAETTLPFFNLQLLTIPGEAIPGEMVLAAKTLLDRNAECLSLLEKTQDKKDCLFPLTYERGAGMDVSHLSKMRDMERLLCLNSLVCAAKGDANGAYMSLRGAYKLSEDLRSDPMMINLLVRIALRSIASTATEQALNRVRLDASQLTALQSMVATMREPGEYRRALISERCLGLTIADAVQQGTLPLDKENEAVFLAIKDDPDVMAREQVAFLDAMEKGIAIAAQPFPQMLDEAEALADGVDLANQSNVSGNSKLVASTLPSLMKCSRAVARDTATLTVTETALALRRFQLAEKKLPVKLDELVPTYLKAVPTDPFDGQTLRYVAKGDGFTVYSTGLNRSDDGGKKYSDSGQQSDYGDIAFVFDLAKL